MYIRLKRNNYYSFKCDVYNYFINKVFVRLISRLPNKILKVSLTEITSHFNSVPLYVRVHKKYSKL